MASLIKVRTTRFVDREGRRVPKGTSGAKVVREKSKVWYGQIKVDGRWKRVPLFTDKESSRQRLAELVRESERAETGLADPNAMQKKGPIANLISAYESSLRQANVSPKHLAETLRRLRAVIDGCHIGALKDLRPEAVETFLAGMASAEVGTRTRNTYLCSVKAFSAWVAETLRIHNPLDQLHQVTKAEVRRKRRALTEAELVKLLAVARARPLGEAMTVRRGKRKGQVVANVRPEVRARLERLGWERVLIYKMAVLTGLRRGELAALEVRHLFLDAPRPRVALPAWDTKGGSDADLPLRMDLATDLRAWIEATGKGEADRLFRVPTELVKILKRDLAHAGIPYRDGRGQTFDVHALRHTTQTHLAKAKVSPTIARGFMRHTDINLTLKTYTDPRLLDEAEALEALPDLPLSGGEGTNKKRGAAAG